MDTFWIRTLILDTATVRFGYDNCVLDTFWIRFHRFWIRFGYGHGVAQQFWIRVIFGYASSKLVQTAIGVFGKLFWIRFGYAHASAAYPQIMDTSTREGICMYVYVCTLYMYICICIYVYMCICVYV